MEFYRLLQIVRLKTEKIVKEFLWQQVLIVVLLLLKISVNVLAKSYNRFWNSVDKMSSTEYSLVNLPYDQNWDHEMITDPGPKKDPTSDVST